MQPEKRRSHADLRKKVIDILTPQRNGVTFTLVAKLKIYINYFNNIVILPKKYPRTSNRKLIHSFHDVGLIRNSRVLIGSGNVIVTGESLSVFAENVCK